MYIDLFTQVIHRQLLQYVSICIMGYFVPSILSVAVAVIIYILHTDVTFNKDDIKGRNVVITGASSGIGEALAYEYARLGANVFITARREDRLKQVVQKCKSLNPSGIYGYYSADMLRYKKESPLLIKNALNTLQTINTLIVNHVFFGKLTAWQGTQEQLNMFEDMMAINVNSYVHIASHALPHMKSVQNGKIGILSSIVGKVSMPLVTAYSSSKFAIDGFFSSLRDELHQGKTNMTVTLAVLGQIDTDGSNKIRKQFGEVSVLSAGNPVIADATEAATQVIRATETGQRELYFPTWYAGRFVNMPASWIAIVRHIWSSLVEMVEFDESTYKN